MSLTGLCWSHSIVCCRVQILGQGIGDMLNSVARLKISLQKSVFLGCNDVLGIGDHGKVSKLNRGTSLHCKPIHIGTVASSCCQILCRLSDRDITPHLQ